MKPILQIQMSKILLFLCCFNVASINAQEVTTLAGVGEGYVDGTTAIARFNKPQGVAVDNAGNTYVADTYNYCIRKITPDGIVSTLAGSNTRGYADGTGSEARFSFPVGVAADTEGNVYVSDYFSNRVRKVTPDGVVTTLAGSGGTGGANGTGTAATFYYPSGIAVGPDGNIYVSEYYGHRVRKITPEGVVTTFASTSQGFHIPKGIDFDSAGNCYVVDSDNNRIRKITPEGVTSTIAGGNRGFADGTGSAARFEYPTGIAIDAFDNMYISDSNNQRIRKITPAGVVTTIAGSGTVGLNNGEGATATFNYPQGIAIDNEGSLYVADFSNNRIRKITGILLTDKYMLENSVSLYPNPTSGLINLEVENLIASEAVIYDINGRALQSEKITGNNKSINLSNLTSGVYLIRITTNKGILSKKIVKQ